MVLSSGVPDATFWTVTLPPLLCAALAAGLAAAWSVVEQYMRKDVNIQSAEVETLDGEPFEL